jgi:segregation and condensation protein B
VENNSNEKFIEESIIESVLFTMGDAVEIDTLALSLSKDAKYTKEVCERLFERYDKNEYGMKIIRLNDKYQMVSNEKYFENLIKVASHPTKPVLTVPILETLSIIAYKQPCSKADIEKIRGYSPDYAINKLLEYGLIEESGRLETPGRPIVFSTTEDFLRRFRLESLDMLPKIDSDKEAQIEEEVRVEVREAFDKQKIDVESDSISDEIEQSSSEILENQNLNEDDNDNNFDDQNTDIDTEGNN